MREHQGSEWGRWSLFAGLWSWALLLHQATFDRWQYSPLGWALCALAACLALAPRSLSLLSATILVNTAYAVQCLPHTANHLVFEGMLCACWALLLGAHLFRRRRAGAGASAPSSRSSPRSTLASRAAGHPLEPSRRALGVALLLVYWLSVLHKLNYDFVDPEASCAAYMYRRVATALPFLPRAAWAEAIAIWGTLLAEAALPALLLWRKSWQLGLVAALSFHLLLGFDPTPGIYSFTGLLFALFVLVLPEGFVEAALERLRALVARVGARPLFAARAAGVLVLGSLLLYGATRHDRWAFEPGFVFFLAWAAVVIAGYGATLLGLGAASAGAGVASEEDASVAASASGSAARPGAGAAAPRFPRPPTLARVAVWLLPAVVLLNGLSPYLGLRTQLSFSMFSNLRTEGGISNHLFMPRLVSLGSYQEDLVEILASDDPDLARYASEELLLPYFEFRRLVGGLGDVSVTYRRGGERRTFECAEGRCNDAELSQPPSGVMARLLYFRPVDKGPHMLCRH